MNCQFRPIALSLLLLAAFAGSVFGQEKTAEKAQGTRLVPPRLSPALPFTTQDVALAKMDETGKMLRMIVPRFKLVSKPQTIKVTRTRTETREREVVNADGEKVLQRYSVNVPYSETHMREISALEADSEDRLKMPIEHVMAWELDGTRIEADELPNRAAKPMHFFVARSNFTGVPAYFREAFNPNMVVIFVGKDFTKTYADAEAPTKPNPAK